jgi:hypothetical protein
MSQSSKHRRRVASVLAPERTKQKSAPARIALERRPAALTGASCCARSLAGPDRRVRVGWANNSLVVLTVSSTLAAVKSCAWKIPLAHPTPANSTARSSTRAFDKNLAGSCSFCCWRASNNHESGNRHIRSGGLSRYWRGAAPGRAYWRPAQWAYRPALPRKGRQSGKRRFTPPLKFSRVRDCVRPIHSTCLQGACEVYVRLLLPAQLQYPALACMFLRRMRG